MSIMTNPDFWAGQSVFITGHMGFKGAWLTRIMSRFGAITTGFGRDDRDPLLYRSIAYDNHTHIEADIIETDRLEKAMKDAAPSVLFHLAAQPIVVKSYDDPLETFNSNIMGTASVLQAARNIPSIRSIVIVTSDKVYHNNEWCWPYRETDRLGGSDPYSASKAAAEIVTDSMVASFYKDSTSASVSTVRAGNVIGGGDWAEYRLLPDGARAFGAGETLSIRNPYSTRPWQHVLEPLAAYMLLAECMVEDGQSFAGAWNFGPKPQDAIPVNEVADIFVSAWGGDARWELAEQSTTPPVKEANFLAVDIAKARKSLHWEPHWNVREAISRTAKWYREYFGHPATATALMDADIEAYFHSGGKTQESS